MSNEIYLGTNGAGISIHLHKIVTANYLGSPIKKAIIWQKTNASTTRYDFYYSPDTTSAQILSDLLW